MVPITATDANGNQRTQNYQVVVPAGTASAYGYDAEGNLLEEPTKTYEWDAANRLIAINYKGTSKRTEFAYDPLGRRAKVVEKENGSVTSDKRLVWNGLELCEERDSTNAVNTRRFYPQGEQINGQSYYYTRDHLGSVRELTDGSGTVRARYDYDLWGNRSENQVTGQTSVESTLGYTGHYYHAQSNLHIAPYRAYDSRIGRWISRDPIAEIDGINLYGYVGNNPVIRLDPLGLWQFTFSYGGGQLCISFGRNSGQWNLTIRGGLGEGISVGWDVSDSGCKRSGWNPITLAISGGSPWFGGSGEIGQSPDGMYGTASGRVFIAQAGGSVTAPADCAPSYAPVGGYGNWGFTVFIGGGYTWTR